MDLGASARRLSQPQLTHIAWQAWARAVRERRAIAIFCPLFFGFRAGTRGAPTLLLCSHAVVKDRLSYAAEQRRKAL